MYMDTAQSMHWNSDPHQRQALELFRWSQPFNKKTDIFKHAWWFGTSHGRCFRSELVCLNFIQPSLSNDFFQ